MKKLAVLTALLLISLSASASAHPVSHLVYMESIDGSDALGVPSPAFSQPRLVAIDQANQFLYVASESDRIYKINAQTHASAPFAALSGTEPTSVITGQAVRGLGNFAVDNSGGVTQGRIYAFGQSTFPPEVGTPALYYPSGTKATPEEFSLNRLSGAACGTEVAPDGSIWVRYTYNSSGGLRQYPSNGGNITGRVIDGGYSEGVCGQFAIDSQENFYTPEYECCSFIRKFNAAGVFQYSLGAGNSKSVAVDRSDNSVFVNDSNVITEYTADGPQIDKFGQAEEYAPGQHYGGLSESPSLVVDEQTKDVFAVNPATNSIDVFAPGPPKTAADVTIRDPLTTFSDAVLRGVVNPDGVATIECYFEWGKTTAYGQKANCSEGSVFSGSEDQAVSLEIPVSVGTQYNTRLVVKNEEGLVSKSANLHFNPQQKPVIDRLFIDALNSDSARLNSLIDVGLGDTTYRFEYGLDTSYGTTVPVPSGVTPAQFLPSAVAETIHGLQPGTTYDYRVVATNLGGTAERSGTFTTFPQTPVLIDSCPNALSRQQTGAALLPDCRSYELASASDTGGYNVESDLVPGQSPFEGHPAVDGELLYGTHNGGIPGTGSPTNLGLDPYLAVRGDEGWTTKYVGVPADGTPSLIPFSSTLLGADQSLDTFAFGGPDICAPCFGDGSSGIPERRGASDLAQGMAGPIDPGPSAKPDGLISKPLSADGSHLTFGSVSQFHEDGNDETGDVSIYDRNLDTRTTQVVSTDPSGNPLACLQGAGTCHSPANANGIAELDVSSDGLRIVVAQKVSTDTDGNVYWHPYMHVGSDSHTIDLAPGTASGVLFDGMTADGSKVFFTTRDKLAGGDTDSNADIYMDEIGGGSTVVPRLVSVKSDGEPSNASSCHPEIDWNTVEPGPNCDAVALGGGAGVAPGNGTFYFLSPELLDGANGDVDQTNLYVVKPGDAPHFVTTMDSSLRKPGPAPPSRTLSKKPLITGIAKPRALAVNDTTGDIYVEDAQKEVIERFTKSGGPHPFTEGAGAGTNELLKSNGESPVVGASEFEQIAVDNHPGSPLQGAVYVASANSPQSDLNVFSESGEQIGAIKGIPRPCGVTVEKSSGDVYVGDASYSGSMWKLHLVSATLPLTLANYEVTQIQAETESKAGSPCQLAVDTVGHVYEISARLYQGNPDNSFFMSVFEDSSFASPPGPTLPGEFIAANIQALAVDPETNELFTDLRSRISVHGPLGELREVLATGEIKDSKGIAVNTVTHHIYATSRHEVVEIGYESDPSKPIDNPAVLHAVHQSGVRHPEDFQVSSDGRFAAFPSGAKITDYNSYGKRQVYRYDDQTDSTICASCPPSNSAVFHDASLASNGNSVTSDGRVFFNSRDPLALRDTNGNLDAYESNDGDVELISAGSGPFDSGLYSVSEDGKDALFFTRDKLAPGDQNGSLMRIYDAREEGGFFHIPTPPPCAASDECHGPGSQAAPPAEIGSLGGTRGNVGEKKVGCRRSFVKKRGKCVHKRHHRENHRSQKRLAHR
jgi:hypothetical protein